MIFSQSLNPVTAATATPNYTGGNYVANGLTHKIRIYAFKNTAYGILIADYFEKSFTDDGSLSNYQIDWDWTLVDGADGYIVVKQQLSECEQNFDAFIDVAGGPITDDQCSNWTAGLPSWLNPNSPMTIAITPQADVPRANPLKTNLMLSVIAQNIS